MLVILLGTLLIAAPAARAELAEVSYTSVGSSTYAVPFEYIDTDHVSVSVDGVDVTFTWDDPTTLRPDVTPTTDQVVRVYRDTPIDDAVVTFSRGVRMTANRLNKAINQALYIAQEIEDDKDQAAVTIVDNSAAVVDHEARITAEEDYTIISTSTLADLLVRVTAVELVIDEASETPGNDTVPINDITAPDIPSSVFVQSSGDGFISMQWTANTEADFAYYDVGRSLIPSGGTYTAVNTNPITGSIYVDSTAVNDTAYEYAVRAVDASGNASDWSEPLTVTTSAPSDPGTTDLKFDFGTSGSVTETDYTKVTSNDAYSIPTGYGWSAGSINEKDRSPTEATDTPDLNTDLNRTGNGTFSVTLPNGTYDVAWGMGDSGSGYVDSGYYLEGTLVHEQSTLNSQQFVTVTKTVTVADGVLDFAMVLTNSPSASINVPINWMTIVDNATGTPSPPYSGGGDDPPVGTPSDANGFAGMNLHDARYWSATIPFKNVMLQSREGWTISGGTATYDGNNWPILQSGATALTRTLTAINGAYPAGSYEVTWDGTGTVEISGDVDSTVSDTDGTLTAVVTTPANQGLVVTISNSGVLDHVRNIKIILPGEDESTGSFNPDFLGAVGPFGTLRFMDWQRINNSDVVNWSDLHGPTHSTTDTDEGMAIEFMVELANTLEADPWFCMPLYASDDFIREFATYVRNNLDPTLTVYIEYSNEIWNVGFTQYHDVKAITGGELGSDEFSAYWAAGCDRTFSIWSDVWDDADKGTGGDETARLVRTVAGQAANSYVTGKVAGLVTEGIDAISPAAYFGHSSGGSEYTSATTSTQMLTAAAARITDVVGPRIANHKVIADLYSARLICYEGGQHWFANHPAILDRDLQSEAFAIQTDAAMATRYDELMDECYAEGVDLLMFFNDTRRPDSNGSWGHLERQDGWQTTPVDYLNGTGSIKYKAILDWTP